MSDSLSVFRAIVEAAEEALLWPPRFFFVFFFLLIKAIYWKSTRNGYNAIHRINPSPVDKY